MLSKAVLAVPVRGGRTRAEATIQLLRKTLQLWEAGRILTLWNDVKSSFQSLRAGAVKRFREGDFIWTDLVRQQLYAPDSFISTNENRHIVQMVNSGLVSRACRIWYLAASIWQQLFHAAYSSQTVAKIESLFPSRPIDGQKAWHSEAAKRDASMSSVASGAVPSYLVCGCLVHQLEKTLVSREASDDVNGDPTLE